MRRVLIREITKHGRPEDDDKKFTFEISLSVLNRFSSEPVPFVCAVIGEAISNAWDADAKKVEILIDNEANSFLVRDDGIGMTGDDFQNKFLKIGYSKRKAGQKVSGGSAVHWQKGHRKSWRSSRAPARSPSFQGSAAGPG